MKNFIDFKFGDRKLSDLNGIIYTEEKDRFNYQIGRQPQHKTCYVQGKGQIYYGTEYGTLEFVVPCYFEGDLDETELVEWIINSGQQNFRYIGDTKYCEAVYNGQLEVTVSFKEGKKYNLVNIPFISYSGWINE